MFEIFQEQHVNFQLQKLWVLACKFKKVRNTVDLGSKVNELYIVLKLDINDCDSER